MEVMVAVQSGTLLIALRVQLKRRVSARRGGDYNEVPQATQKKSRPSPSNCVIPFACKLRPEQGFRFQKASLAGCVCMRAISRATRSKMRLRTEEAPPYRPMTGATTRPLWPRSLSSLPIGPPWSYFMPRSSIELSCSIVVLLLGNFLPLFQQSDN